jgi:Zn-dependent protease with chaperone function
MKGTGAARKQPGLIGSHAVVAVQAVASLLLLAGLYILGSVFVVAAVGLAVYGLVSRAHGGNATPVYYPLPVAVVIAGALYGISRQARTDLRGWPVDRQAAPALWGLVDSLAAYMGATAPQEIRLIPQPRAAMTEEPELLGLIGGTSCLYIGVPLLRVLPAAELTAIVCHELGHYSHGHTRLGEVSYRTRVALTDLTDGLGRYQGNIVAGAVRKGAGWYLRLALRLSSALARQRELEADEYAVWCTSREATSAALISVYALQRLWEDFRRGYLEPVAARGVLPPDVFATFEAMLRDPVVASRRQDLAEQAPTDEHVGRHDSHPSVAGRLRKIAEYAEYKESKESKAPPAIPDSLAGGTWQPGPVQRLLLPDAAGADATAPAAEGKAVTEGEWERLVAQAQAERAAAVVLAAARAGNQPRTVGEVIELAGHAGAARLAAGLPGVAVARQWPPEPHERLATSLTAVAVRALVAAGLADWELSWSAPVAFSCDVTNWAKLRDLAAGALAGEQGAATLCAAIARLGGDLAAPATGPLRGGRGAPAASASGAQPASGQADGPSGATGDDPVSYPWEVPEPVALMAGDMKLGGYLGTVPVAGRLSSLVASIVITVVVVPLAAYLDWLAAADGTGGADGQAILVLVFLSALALAGPPWIVTAIRSRHYGAYRFKAGFIDLRRRSLRGYRWTDFTGARFVTLHYAGKPQRAHVLAFSEGTATNSIVFRDYAYPRIRELLDQIPDQATRQLPRNPAKTRHACRAFAGPVPRSAQQFRVTCSQTPLTAMADSPVRPHHGMSCAAGPLSSNAAT